MHLGLRLKIQLALGRDFRVHQDTSGYIFFKDRRQRANYSLYSVGMQDAQILQIAKIVGQVFEKQDKDNRLRSNHDVPTQNLNSTSELSQQYVARVLNLNGTYLHKFFLLTSGAYLSSPGTDDLLITLAESKVESPYGLEQAEGISRVFETLQEIYVLPGVYAQNSYYTTRQIINAAIMRHSVEMIARLLAFVSNSSNKMTLSEYLRLNDDSAFQTDQPIEGFDRFAFIEMFLSRKREYHELGHKLTSDELYSLSVLMHEGYQKIPEDFLYSRVTVMAPPPRERRLLRPVTSYLSKTELYKFSQEEMKSINKLTIEAHPKFWATEPIVYAAIAEVLAQKGYKRTLEVLHELMKAEGSRNDSREYTEDSIKYTEATVLLILEALNSENAEMPFSWAAQMSEHGWTLNSYSSCEYLIDEVL
jgi:hypothetical protein